MTAYFRKTTSEQWESASVDLIYTKTWSVARRVAAGLTIIISNWNPLVITRPTVGKRWVSLDNLFNVCFLVKLNSFLIFLRKLIVKHQSNLHLTGKLVRARFVFASMLLIYSVSNVSEASAYWLRESFGRFRARSFVIRVPPISIECLSNSTTI